MSRSISTAMQTHLALPQTSLITCWKAELTDSTILGFTNHTRPLLIDALNYLPEVGVTPSTVDSSAGTGVDNIEIHSVIDSDIIKAEDLISGRFDFARITVFMVNVDDLSMGKIIMHKGVIGEVSFKNQEFIAEVRSYLQMVSKDILELTSPSCRVVKLGDNRCKVDLSGSTDPGDIGGGHAIRQTVVVAAVGNRKTFSISSFFSGTPDNFFQYGEALFQTGANAGRKVGVKFNVLTGVPGVSNIFLIEETPYNIGAGDLIQFTAGCDRSWNMCKNRFANTLNFRGEPGIPGADIGIGTGVLAVASQSFFSQLGG